MRLLVILPIAAAAFVGTAGHAQATDPYQGYGVQQPPQGGSGYDQGYAPGYPGAGYDQGYGDNAAPPPPPPRGGTSYSDDERWSGGDNYGTADARPVPRQGYGRAPDPRSRPYAERIARWRARADACEAGDLRACRGPE